MNSEQIKSFQQLAALGSFNKVAEEEHYSTQGIIRRINDLELELGHKLVNRTHRGITLTASGRIFLDFINETSAIYHNATEKMKLADSALIYGIDDRYVYPEDYRIISILQSSGFSVDLVPCSQNEVYEKLARKEINTALLPMCSVLQDRFHIEKVLTVPLSVISSFRITSRLKLKDLKDMEIFISSFGSDIFNEIFDTLRKNNTVKEIETISDYYILTSNPKAVIIGSGFDEHSLAPNMYYGEITDIRMPLCLYVDKSLPESSRILNIIKETFGTETSAI